MTSKLAPGKNPEVLDSRTQQVLQLPTAASQKMDLAHKAVVKNSMSLCYESAHTPILFPKRLLKRGLGDVFDVASINQ